MNNEFIEEKKNDTNKILILIIIVLILALGGFSYYTFFVKNNEKENKPNSVVKSVTTEPTSAPESQKTIVTNEKLLKEIDKYDLTATITSYLSCIGYPDKDKMRFDNLNTNDRIAAIITNINWKYDHNYLSMENVWSTSFANYDDNINENVIFTNEEKNFYETNQYYKWMYISDFNKYALDIFKFVSPLKNEISYNAGMGYGKMSTYNDKIFFGVAVGCEGYDPIFTSLSIDDETIELMRTIYNYDTNEKEKDIKYTFKYNGSIYDLVQAEIIKVYE